MLKNPPERKQSVALVDIVVDIPWELIDDKENLKLSDLKTDSNFRWLVIGSVFMSAGFLAPWFFILQFAEENGVERASM